MPLAINKYGKLVHATGRQRHRAGEMNKLEQEWAAMLELRKKTGDTRVLWWAWESVKFRIADKTYYTPDFVVMMEDGELQIHETKGFMEDDARVKVKAVAELFPMRVFVMRKVKGEWSTEEI